MQRHKLILLTIIACITTVYAGVGALDQSAAGVSARAVGLGQAVGSMYDDPANFIYNPATMATIIRPKTFLLSTKTLQEVNYINGGVVFPVEGIGVWGIAALNRNVTQIPLTDDFVFNGNEIDYEAINYARYDENLYVIGYAQHLSLFERGFNWGLSTKVFQRTTTKVQDGTASGFNLDLGCAVDVVPEVTVGLAYKNLLRGSSTGALLWATGEAEPMDAYLDLGISSTRLQKNVYVGLDLIKNTSRAAYPWNIRFGIEWHPLDALFVRGGVQQQYIASDIDNTSQMNITNAYSVGLGLNLYGWRLDYAYRPDTDIKELSSHWISLSLVGPEPCVAEAIPVITSGNQTPTPAEIITESALVLLSPDNRTVTTARQIVVMGMVYQELACVVNGQEYPLTKNNVFAVPVALALGLNDITLSTPQKKTTIGLKILCLANFADISDSTYKDAIVTMATLGYMSGDYPDRFNPQRYVSRAEMADIVVRMQRLSTPVQLRAIMDSVDMLSAQGLLKGYPDGLMRPEERLTLGQLSLVLARLQNLPFKTMTSTVGYLAQDHWSEQAVAALVETQLYTLADFSPRNAPVTKEKLAYFLSRLPIVQDSTTRLNNFETFVAAEQSAVFFMHKPGVETVQSDEDIFNRLIGDDANKLLPSAIDQTEMLGARLQKPTPNQTILKKTIVATAPDRQKYILLRNKGIIDNQPPEYLLNQQELAVILKRVYGLSLETQTQSLVSRAYAIALIVRAEKLSLTSNDLAPYKDVNTKNWAYRQIAVAKAKGFLPKGDYLKPFQAIDLQTLAIYLANTPTVKKKLSAQ